MIFYAADISHFHFFRCHLVSHLGSLLQKCDPDRRDQNSHESRLCFFTQQTFPIFIPLAVTWDPNLDPCDKSVILTGAIKIHIKIVYGFLPTRHFPFSFIWLSLGVPTWILAAKVWSWQARAKFTWKSFMFFLSIRHFPFSFIWLSLGVPTWILAAKVWSWQARSKFT